jgi:hypothetical protein
MKKSLIPVRACFAREIAIEDPILVSTITNPNPSP